MNLVDFDAVWGHRRNPEGYAKDLKGAGTLNEADSFAAIGATIAENFNVRMPDGTIGESMLDQIQ